MVNVFAEYHSVAAVAHRRAPRCVSANAFAEFHIITTTQRPDSDSDCDTAITMVVVVFLFYFGFCFPNICRLLYNICRMRMRGGVSG